MHNFAYCAPDNLQEAVNLMASHAGSANLLAGGTDLIIFMRARRKQPDMLIDGKKIPELTEIKLDDSGLTLGSAVSCRSIYEHADIAGKFPALIDSTTLIGGVQIQGRATVGGNLCNAAPSADTIPTLIAYGAVANIVSEKETRQLPVEEFCIAPGKTALKNNEILVNIFIPAQPPNSGARFLRFIPRNEMDIAVANAAASITLDDAGTTINAARIAIGAVAPTPLYVEAAGAALVGQTVSDDAILKAAKIARETASPIEDMRGTVEHRLQLVEVLSKRALQGAIARARGETE